MAFSCFALTLAACGESASAVLVEARSDWWTSALGADRGDGWRASAYDPEQQNGWLEMTAPLGYGEPYVHPIPCDPSHRAITVYFRKSFRVDDPAALAALRLDVMVDDGFIVYLNGQEVGRAHMPGGAVDYLTLARPHDSDGRYESFDLSPARASLKPGENLIGVEVHQASASSTDLVFDASLSGAATW